MKLEEFKSALRKRNAIAVESCYSAWRFQEVADHVIQNWKHPKTRSAITPSPMDNICVVMGLMNSDSCGLTDSGKELAEELNLVVYNKPTR